MGAGADHPAGANGNASGHVNGNLNGNGNGAESRAARAAENALLKLGARLVMVVGVPIGLGIGGWAAREVIAATNENTRAIVEIRGDIRALTSGLSGRLDAQADRIKGIDERNTQQDARMDRHEQKLDGIILRLPPRP